MFVDVLLERLAGGAHEGAWGYGYRRESGAAEAAALGALALHAHGRASETVAAALGWLAEQQGDDGGVPITDRVANPRWPTSLALLAWIRAGEGFDDAQTEAVDYLLTHTGKPATNSPLVGHDMELVGWSWVDDTHSWVEPTGYAITALRAAGKADHERVREGVRVLEDRCLPEGGWNYGNTRVLHNVLRPFPATTGVAMVALAGESRSDVVERTLVYLREIGPTLRAPVSLSWAVLGMRAWDAAPDEAMEWLERCALEPGRRPPDPVHDALLLLAATPYGFLNGAPAPQLSEASDGEASEEEE